MIDSAPRVVAVGEWRSASVTCVGAIGFDHAHRGGFVVAVRSRNS